MKIGKFILLMTMLAVFAGVAAAKDLKILTIGNSFASSVFGNLPSIVKDFPDCKLTLVSANLGGCSLERHWKNSKKEEGKAELKYYKKRGKDYKLVEMLQMEKWDIVTIQQASHLSWDAKSFQPYADNIVALIKKYAPTAEIVIQQTWAYRSDAQRLKEWKFDQSEMYTKLDKNYKDLAQHLNARVIPSGWAIQLYREARPDDCSALTREALAKLEYPALPDESKNIVGNLAWRKDKTTGERKLINDPIHLSKRGAYLQACVWFGLLFDKKTSEIKYLPKTMKADDAVFLRGIAQKAIDTYPQVKVEKK